MTSNLSDLFSANYQEENDPNTDVDNTYDLCDKYKSKWVDVTTNSEGKWYAMYNGNRVTEHHTDRGDARDSLISWIKNNIENIEHDRV